MSTHVSSLFKSESFTLRHIETICQFLDQPPNWTVVNSLLYGLPDKEISQPQHIQNLATWLFTKTRKVNFISCPHINIIIILTPMHMIDLLNLHQLLFFNVLTPFIVKYTVQMKLP